MDAQILGIFVHFGGILFFPKPFISFLILVCVYIIVMYIWLWRECNSRVWWFSYYQSSHPAVETKSAEVMGDTSRM